VRGATVWVTIPEVTEAEPVIEVRRLCLYLDSFLISVCFLKGVEQLWYRHPGFALVRE
jgi:hypothetical protein